jgi:guanine deaminase
VDTHLHAPQYAYTGTGYELQLIDWLQKYAFPTETRFTDEVYARMVFEKVVKR